MGKLRVVQARLHIGSCYCNELETTPAVVHAVVHAATTGHAAWVELGNHQHRLLFDKGFEQLLLTASDLNATISFGDVHKQMCICRERWTNQSSLLDHLWYLSLR